MIPGTPITLDKQRNLKYTFRSWRYLEEKTGFSILKSGLTVDKFEETDFFLHCLVAGLINEDPTVTVEIIDGFNVAGAASIAETMMEAISLSFTPVTESTTNPTVAQS